MKPSWFCSFAFLICSFTAFAQPQLPTGLMHQSGEFADPASALLWGQVTDASTGKPLVGASLYFPDLRRGTTSNEAGEFRIEGLPTGSYVIDVSFLGYSAIARTISIMGDTHQDFALTQSVVENENVVVTGVSKATELKLTPTPISIMKKTELNRSSATNIIEALTRKSGVSAVTTGPAIAKPVIRGLGYNRVITLNDGIRQEGQQWGDEHGIEIDEYSVQKAEVLRGPASLIYGSDALGGVLNIISTTQVNDGVVKANIVGSGNSNNHMLGGHADVAGKINGINFSAYASGKSAGDYQNSYDGYVLDSRFRENDFGAAVGLNRKWGYSHLTVSNFDQKTGLVEGERNDEGKFLLYSGTPLETVASDEVLKGRDLLVPYQHISHFKLVSDNSFSVGEDRLTAVLGWQSNKRREFGNPEEPETPNAYFQLNTFNYNIGYHFADKKGWKTALGASGMMQGNTNKAPEAIIPNYNLVDGGLFLITQKTLPQKVNISGGVRIDNRWLDIMQMKDENGGVKFAALTRSITNISASAGFSYFASEKIIVKANLSRGFRAPSAPELSANGEHEGTNRYEIGNPDLSSETSMEGDAGIELNTKHISLSFTPFYNSISHYIFIEKLRAVNGGDSLTDKGNGDKVPTYKFNQQNASLAGFEFNFDLHPHPFDWLHFENTVSYVNGQFQHAIEGTTNLPMIAPLRWISELRAEFASMKHAKMFGNAYFKIEADVNAAQNKAFTAYNTETNTPAYTLLNAGFGTDFKSKQKTIAILNIGMNNLTDVSYQNHLSRLKYTAENVVTGRQGVYNMGRNFTARIIIPMEFKVKSRS